MNNKRLFFVLTFIFVALAVPFKTMSLIPGFTEVRPVDALYMLYGVIFGFYGALACAVGNIISDFLGGTLAISSWAGFVGSFLGSYLAYVIWYALAKREPFIDDIKQAAVFIITSIITGIVMAALVAFAVIISYEDIDGFSLFIQVFVNSVVFSVALAMPLVILLKAVYKIKGIVPKKYNKGLKEEMTYEVQN